MAQAGLSNLNPLVSSTPGSDLNPLVSRAPPVVSGLDALQQSLASITAMGEAARAQVRTPTSGLVAPSAQQASTPTIAFSPSRSEFFVQGRTFSKDDAQSALESEALLGQPSAPLPTGDWVSVDPQSYAGYLQGIKNPSLGTLFSKGISRGVDASQLLVGRGLQLAGAEEFGGRIVEKQMEDLRRATPFARQFTDIEDPGDALEWFVAGFGEQVPNLLESVAVAGAGAIGGTFTGGPGVGTAAGALAGLAGKSAFKQQVLAAARKKAAGEVLNQAEKKILRSAGALVGATAATFVNSYRVGASDIYGELRDQGADPDDISAKMLALAGAFPYAAAESATEYLLAGRILGGIGAPRALPAGTSLPRRGAELLRRGAVGGAVGGIAEGGTELAQESLLLGLSDQDFSKPENIERLINSFAAGALIGGPLGGVANLKGRKPENLLNPGQNPDPAPAPILLLPAPDPFLRDKGRPDFVVDESGTARATTAEDTVVSATRGFVPPTVPGTQGVLNIFPEGQTTIGGLRDMMEQPAPTEMDSAAPEVDAFQQPIYGVTTPAQASEEWRALAGRGRPKPFAKLLPEIQNQWVDALNMAQAGELAADDLKTIRAELVVAENVARLTKSSPRTVVAGNTRFSFPEPPPPPPAPPPPPPLPLESIQPQFGVRTVAPSPPPAAPPPPPLTKMELASEVGARVRQLGTEGKIDQADVDSIIGMIPFGSLVVPPQLMTNITNRLNNAVAAKATPPKGGQTRALKKPEAAAVSPAKQPATRGETLKRPVARAAAKPAGKPVAKPEVKAEAKVVPVQKGQGKAVQVLKKSEKKPVEPAPPPPPPPPPPSQVLKKGKKKPVEAAPPPPPQPPRGEEEPMTPAEAWEDMKPAGALTFKELPKQVQAQWSSMVGENNASMLNAMEVYGTVDVGPKQAVREAIAAVDESTSQDETFLDAVSTLVEYAFYRNVDTNTKEAITAARDKLEDQRNFTDAQWRAVKAAFVEQANYFKELSATITSPKARNKGAARAWVEFAADNNLGAQIRARITDTGTLEDALKAAIKQAGPVEKQPAVTTQATYQSKSINTDSAVYKLTVLLASKPTVLRLDRPFVFRQENYANLPSALENLFAETDTSDRGALVNGSPLEDYFDADGKPKFEPTPSGLNTPSAKKDDEGRFALASFNQPDRADPAIGKLRMAVTRFVSKLARKPKTYVYRNQADMKAKNAALYRKAVAARPEGDFDTALAAGYSFGDGNVVIFTDRIANEQHLNFVLAHETLGHFGLRGIIPTKQFDAVMEAIYKASPAIRSDVDIAMSNGQSKAEAVEEYLSDFAAVLDTSVVARIWNAIKGALNKLGIKFGDEMVRYVLKQSRSYVRSGKSSMFDAAKVFTDLQDVEYGSGYASTGRFSTVGDSYADNRTAELVRDNIANAPLDWEKAWATVKNIAGNSSDRFDRFKAEFLSLANFRSRLNPGLNRLEEILEAARDLTSSIRVSSNERNAEVFNNAIFGKYFGVTTEQTDSINKLIYAAQRLAVGNVEDIRSLGGAPLYEFKDGVLTPNQSEIGKLINQGMVTLEQARDGFTYEVQLPDGTVRKEKFAGIPGLTKDSVEWRGYLSLRETMNSVELQLLRARYLSLFEDQQITFKQFDELVDNNRLTSPERDLLRRIIKTYNDLYTADITFDDRGYPRLSAAAMENGNNFVVAINKALTLGQDRDFNAVADFFEGKAADDMVAKLREFRKRLRIGNEDKFTIQNRIKQLGIMEVSNSQADLYTRRTLATGYTPLLREGQFQIRVEAVNPRTGKVVRLADAYREQLIYSQVEKQSEALELATGINDIFKDKTYEVDAYNQDAGEFTKQTVIFRAVPEAALDAIAGPPELNLNEFVYGLRQLDIVLTPKEVERVVTALTKQNSSARNRLLRAFTPGADPDAIKAISRHIDSRASTIAKTMIRPQLSELMNLSMGSTQRLWNGDAQLLADLKTEAENTNLSPDERALAQREYERYKYMYEQTNPKGKPKRANQFYNEASRTVSFLDDNRSVAESNFESGAVVSQVRAATSIMQLGGSIATGALNLISAYTNGLPFLASYNPRNGFGGGFGLGPAVREFHIAAKQVGALGMTNMKANTAEFYDAVAKSKDLQTRYGLAAHEAEFIAREIREGAMIPAQTNALINTSRGQISSGFARRFIDGWMLPFNLTEQASRRTLGLAAYRLEYERQLGGGKSEAKAREAARRLAVDTLNLTMGEYSVLNRPPAWRSGIQSFIYMYKVFPTTSIQLFSNMSRSGQIAMLASLWMLSGMQGLPFAEDLEDLIDTLAQALGFKSGSIRMEIAKFIDGVFPGMSPYFLQGVVNSAIPADIAGRVSIGNVFPGTGILLSGADVGRELTDIAGPAPAALIGSATFLADLMRVPFSDRIQLLDAAREAPVTMLRAAGDAVAYAKSDAIVDRRGYIVADDANAGVIAARLLGFYPSAAAQQYSAIRVATRVTDYQKDVVAGFRQAWIKAKMEGDEARARDVVKSVEQWNEGAKGTGLEIGNFVKNSERALKQAKMPAGERTLKTLPKAGREDVEKAFDLLTY